MNNKIYRTLCCAVLMGIGACGGGGGGTSLAPPPITPPVTPPTAAPNVTTERVFRALSFTQPVALKQAPADDSRWYVVEKSGVVRVFDNSDSVSSAQTFLDITSRVNDRFSETGLLGMAFHPSYPATPEVYFSYNGSGSVATSIISKFNLDSTGLALDPGSEQIILQFEQPRSNHNGGDLAFGPNGLLYATFGDGGGGGDPDENGQNTQTLFGTVIRVDVDSGSPYTIPTDNPFAAGVFCSQGSATSDCGEIYAWGFRNPWRMSFDSATAALWLGDVGQGDFEEIDRVELGGNYGWNDREGANCFDPATGCATNFMEPVTEYDHSLGQSVTGGYVYRGTDIAGLTGFYVFADFVSGELFATPADAQPTVTPDQIGNAGFNVSAFAVDVDNRLYALDYSDGGVYRFVPGT